MPSGIIIIDKEAGWTSMDVCAKLRGILKERRVGHGGTLDPMATGVLPVFVGRATRAAEFAEKSDKEYVAGLTLGVTTDTQDIWGEVLSRSPARTSREGLENTIRARFLGEIAQVPPMYSAVKIGGRKLYELARKGKEVERPPRRVFIRELEVLEEYDERHPCPFAPDAHFLLRVRCSKGVYIRTLCHDIGVYERCGGCMSYLRRTMAAGFTIQQAVSLQQVERGDYSLLPVDTLFRRYPSCTLDAAQEKRCRGGAPVEAPGLQEGLYRLYGQNGEFLSLSRWEAGVLRSRKNFFGGGEP